MSISRNVAIWLQRILDQWLPPALRDARWFMFLPMTLRFGSRARGILDFKSRAFELDEQEFRDIYLELGGRRDDTHLNDACERRILDSVVGDSVLEVGTGSGSLAHQLTNGHSVTAVDIVIESDQPLRNPAVRFHEARVERLPFRDDEFDTVVCAHTLEHVQDIQAAMSELRRVAARRLIIVVPRQRPYQFTFNLHVNFFPYRWSLIGQFGNRPEVTIAFLGDWYYQEDWPMAMVGS
jgi:hypothetical protein